MGIGGGRCGLSLEELADEAERVTARSNAPLSAHSSHFYRRKSVENRIHPRARRHSALRAFAIFSFQLFSVSAARHTPAMTLDAAINGLHHLHPGSSPAPGWGHPASPLGPCSPRTTSSIKEAPARRRSASAKEPSACLDYEAQLWLGADIPLLK